MEITDVVVHTVSIEDPEPIANGTQDAAIIEIATDEGITGFGEADCSPPVARAIVDAPTSHDKSAGLREVLVGRNPLDITALWEDAFYRTYYYGRKGAAVIAMSGVDMALWDVKGKFYDCPVYELLGGKHRDSVRAYASTLFPEDPAATDQVRERAESAAAEGFDAVKFGWGGFGASAETDAELVGAARDALGPDADLMVDAGFAWNGDVKGAVKEINRLDREHDLYWVEEPIYADDFAGYAALSRACETRIAGGENEYTAEGFRNLLDFGEVDVLQPDVARSGGITQLRRIASLARTANVSVVPHGYSTNLLVAGTLQLAAADPSIDLIEYSTEESPLRWELTNESIVARDGYVEIPDGPGLGVTVDRDTLETYATDDAR